LGREWHQNIYIAREATYDKSPGVWRLGMAQIRDVPPSVVMAFASIFVIVSMATPARAEDVKQIVQEAVQTEMEAGKADHTKWIYYETDRKPGHTVKQWVAQTPKGSLERVLEENGRTTNEQEQKNRIDSFIKDGGAQEKQRKEFQQDDRESGKMLSMMPHAFLWNIAPSQGDTVTLHFKPNPAYHAPDMESRVFAVTEGDMIVTKAGHRIMTIKGRMMKGVKFVGGLFGGLDPGGTFDVERRQTGEGEWQITETHVHIHGHLLFFKTISEQEDDVKTKFRQLPEDISFEEAEKELMKEP
jgi:hypothetical protein